MPRPFVHLIGPRLWIALDALRPMLCERGGEEDRKNVEVTLGFGVLASRDLKAGEEIVLGQWECGTYAADILRMFFNTFFLFSVGLPTAQYTFVTDSQSIEVDAPPQPNGKHLTYSFTSCARMMWSPRVGLCSHSDGGIRQRARTLRAPLPEK